MSYERHGLRKHPLYERWKAMHARCSRPTHKNYAQYGGRGIRVCERWNSFSVFLADVGMPPDMSLTLDRIDNDRGYEPGNVRWATQKEQCANSRMRSTNRTRLVGVSWNAQQDRYYARRWSTDGSTYIGSTKDFFEACCMRKSYEARGQRAN